MKNIEKIEKIFGMLGSDNAGEIVNACSAIKKLLSAENKNFSDLSNYLFHKEIPTFSQAFTDEKWANSENMMGFLLEQDLSEWEENFVRDLQKKYSGKTHKMTEKQEGCLIRIYKKYGGFYE